MSAKLFPIIAKDAKGRSIKAFISWDVAELLRAQAMKNHGQTLERLAERGGLSWFEAACALAKSDLDKGIKPTDLCAQYMLGGAAHALERKRERDNAR